MSTKSVVLISAFAAAGVCVLFWTLMYLLTGQIYPFGLLIVTLGTALLVGNYLNDRLPPPRKD